MGNSDLIGNILESAKRAAAENAQANLAGQEYAELRHRTIMRAIAKTYSDALNDPKTIIPTALHAMLEAVRQTVKGYPAVDV